MKCGTGPERDPLIASTFLSNWRVKWCMPIFPPFSALRWGTQTSCKVNLMKKLKNMEFFWTESPMSPISSVLGSCPCCAPLPEQITCSGLVLQIRADACCWDQGVLPNAHARSSHTAHVGNGKSSICVGRSVLEKHRAFAVNRTLGQLGRHCTLRSAHVILSSGVGGFHLEAADECRDRIDAPEWGDVAQGSVQGLTQMMSSPRISPIGWQPIAS